MTSLNNQENKEDHKEISKSEETKQEVSTSQNNNQQDHKIKIEGTDKSTIYENIEERK